MREKRCLELKYFIIIAVVAFLYICSSIAAVQNDDSPSILHCRPMVSREQQQPPADDIPRTPSNNGTHVPVNGKRKQKREEKTSDSSLDDPDETEIKGMIFASTPANGHKESKNQETTVRHKHAEAIQTHHLIYSFT